MITDSQMILRGIAEDIASGAITIEDVEKNYKVPAETPCSEESDSTARKIKREKTFFLEEEMCRSYGSSCIKAS